MKFYFCNYREYGSKNGDYDGRYDNLLYYYWFLYSLIQHVRGFLKKKYYKTKIEIKMLDTDVSTNKTALCQPTRGRLH